MTAHRTREQHGRFVFGRWLLLGAALLTVLQHGALTFALAAPVPLLGCTVLNLAGLLVLAGPFARRRPWAWYAGGLVPLGITATAAAAPGLAPGYYALATVCLVGMVLTMRSFCPSARG